MDWRENDSKEAISVSPNEKCPGPEHRCVGWKRMDLGDLGEIPKGPGG